MTILAFLIVLFIVIFAGRKIFTSNLNFNDSINEEYSKNVKKFSTIILIGYLGIFCALSLISAIFTTNEQEIGFTELFGTTTSIETAGVHFKIPFLSKKYVYDATTKGMAIGYVEETDESDESDSLMITSDFNFVNIDFYLEYRISDPIAYTYASDDPESILKNIAQSAIRNTIGQYDVDSVLTTGKSEIETVVYNDIVTELEKHNIGLSVSNITVQDSEPPTSEVSAAFKDVETAKQNAETVINAAEKYANEQIPAAEAEAASVISEAEAYKTERVNAALEEVAAFNAVFAEYQKNPETVKTRMYYETISEVFPNLEIIISSDSKVIYVTGDSSTPIIDEN